MPRRRFPIVRYTQAPDKTNPRRAVFASASPIMPLDSAFQRNGYQKTDGPAYNVTDSGVGQVVEPVQPELLERIRHPGLLLGQPETRGN
jgi:hypothetical protein